MKIPKWRLYVMMACNDGRAARVDAEVYYKRAISLVKKEHGSASIELATVLSEFSNFLEDKGRSKYALTVS